MHETKNDDWSKLNKLPKDWDLRQMCGQKTCGNCIFMDDFLTFRRRPAFSFIQYILDTRLARRA